MSQHMVQCIAVDTDILQAELEWCSHQEKARLDHLLYRSSERERALPQHVQASKTGLFSLKRKQRNHSMSSAYKFIDECGKRLIQNQEHELGQ